MKRNVLIVGILVMVVACLAGCATTPPSTTPTPTPTITATTSPTTSPPGVYTIQTANTAQLGTYLANTNGLALYYFARDVPGSGTTACNTSTCLSLWTPFTPITLKVSPSLNASGFGTISGNQVTYRGWPLYTYNADTVRAPPTGDGFGGIWFVMKKDYSVMIMENSKVGTYLADGAGMTLYNFSNDSPGMSACTNSTSVLIQNRTCIEFWPPFYTGTPVVPSALNPSDFSTVMRSDGLEQSTFRGMALYYFLADTKPGDTNGQGINSFGGFWYVISPQTAAPTPTTIPLTTTQSSGGGYGY
jgi:predicted lipoprotein with Yx(FWY)xxD motif